jgi:hypothetical protein
MKIAVLKFAFVLVCILSVTALYAQPAEQKVSVDQFRFLQKAKLIGEAINSHRIEAIVAEFDELLQRELPVEKLKPLIYQITDSLGLIEKMSEVKMKWKNVAIVTILFKNGMLDMQLSLDAQDKINGIYFFPHRKEAPIPERNRTSLTMPIKGQWNVVWGGNTIEDNYHHNVRNQRFAVDFNILDEIGRSHIGDETLNESFFAFGKEVMAPAGGVVTEAIDGVRDNPPFLANEYSAVGNCVIIQHSDSEFSVLAHLKNGSVRVKAGDKVTRGEIIGLCGNSGSSTEPHLHYHLQNTANLAEATGIKLYISDVFVANKEHGQELQKEYTPMRGDRISSKMNDDDSK